MLRNRSADTCTGADALVRCTSQANGAAPTWMRRTTTLRARASLLIRMGSVLLLVEAVIPWADPGGCDPGHVVDIFSGYRLAAQTALVMQARRGPFWNGRRLSDSCAPANTGLPWIRCPGFLSMRGNPSA